MCEKYLYDLATDKAKGGIAAIIKPVLFFFSLLYGLIVFFIRFISIISGRKPGCKVLSVGNITLGGTGKTVIVEFICRYLREKGRKVAVLTRGYARPQVSAQRTQPGYETMGDEPYMLQAKLADVPVMVNPDRFKGADKAVKEFQVDTVVLDDGFQQWRIKKDLEIAAIDAVNPFGNGMLIPRGILREPVSSLSRADVLILTNTDLAKDTAGLKHRLSRINPSALIIGAAHQPEGLYKIKQEDVLIPVESLRSKTVAIACAIGNPGSFQGLLEKSQARVGLVFIFPDHYRYTQDDLERIASQAGEKGINTLVITEKDAVKIAGMDLRKTALDILVLKIKLRINENEQGFLDRLLGVYTS
ncbi:MAG: tetraacyldisaccharide 4'-kinase [Candidatus Omnitrophica bacterium]|nr:tetraacyldisaccharide 4'-kinase [Candidatus Omnitrophota bacterium]MDD5079317.1 tetraacyldisaccharide 4'-kinase [Candidatus Omnitrophota bacterium]